MLELRQILPFLEHRGVGLELYKPSVVLDLFAIERVLNILDAFHEFDCVGRDALAKLGKLKSDLVELGLDGGYTLLDQRSLGVKVLLERVVLSEQVVEPGELFLCMLLQLLDRILVIALRVVVLLGHLDHALLRLF